MFSCRSETWRAKWPQSGHMRARRQQLGRESVGIGKPVHHRICVAVRKKLRISGPQPLVSVLEILSSSEADIWKILDERAYLHTIIDVLGEQIDYRLVQFGIGELSKLTGHNKKTVQDAIRRLQEVHLVDKILYNQPVARDHVASIYSLFDPVSATVQLRADGYTAWRQVGRGRVLMST